MASTVVNISNWKGLHVQANSFALVPDGALEIANNVVVTRDGVLQKRRGHFAFISFLSNAIALSEYQDTLIMPYDTDKLAKVSSLGVVTDLGSGLSMPTWPRFAEAGGKLFFTTNQGIKALDSLSATIRNAGLPPALDLEVTLSAQTGPIPPNCKVGYRIIFGFDGANGERLLSAPSSFVSVTNALNNNITASNVGSAVTISHTGHGYTGTPTIVVVAARDASGNVISGVAGQYTATVTGLNTVTFTSIATPSAAIATLDYGVYKQGNISYTIPAGLTTDNFVQIYRTDASADEDIDPDEDTLKLITEAKLGTTGVAFGYDTATDLVDPLFAGAYCYTNANTGQGIANANYPPPLCDDIALFKGSLFFAATTLKHQLPMLLLSAATMQVNDTVTVGGQTYTCKTVENVTNREFLKISSGSVAFDHDQMARSLCKCINRNANSPVVAYYTSGPSDIPGQIIIEARTYGVAFTFACSRASTWTPDALTALDSSAASDAHVLRFSKTEEFEHVPAWAYLPIGNKGEAILRIVALRDSLIVVKENSIWRVNGDAGNFAATLLDNTLSCRAPNSVVPLNNAVWMITNQGITSVTDSGASVVSRQIEPLITSVLGMQAFYDHTVAVAYESDRAYIVATISNQAEGNADIVYYYNTVTQAFTTWDTPWQAAIVLKNDDKLYYVSGTDLYKERKNLNKVDYTDTSYTVTIGVVAADKLSAEIITVGANISAGDIIVYNNTINLIEDADYSVTPPVCTFRNRVTFAVGNTAYHYTAIISRVKTAPITLGSNGVMKQFSEVSLHCRNNSLSASVIRFANDSVESSSDTAFTTPSALIGWGISYWGQRQWGDPDGIDVDFRTGISQPFRTYVPQDCQRGTFLQIDIAHAAAGESMDIQMLSVKARPIATRV